MKFFLHSRQTCSDSYYYEKSVKLLLVKFEKKREIKNENGKKKKKKERKKEKPVDETLVSSVNGERVIGPIVSISSS